MNIFWLDSNPIKNVQFHCDKHVIKMCLEYAQILCSSLHLNKYEKPEQLYRLTHKGHPCVKWTSESYRNWNLLYSLLILLNDEYKYRYNKNINHKSADKILSLDKTLIKKCFNKYELTHPPLCMPDDCKCNDLYESYRNYYIKYKKDIVNWKNRKVPYWFKENDSNIKKKIRMILNEI